MAGCSIPNIPAISASQSRSAGQHGMLHCKTLSREAVQPTILPHFVFESHLCDWSNVGMILQCTIPISRKKS
jgi:hypothetical protein